MIAWVTIAPRGESASLSIILPVLKSQTPTQLRVTVAAMFLSDEMLKIRFQKFEN
jgi:hypothetical protein